MQPGSKTTLHFVRHANAVPDDGADLADGGYDRLGLSARGVLQAEALARRLAATTDLAAIYASPTRRAFETASAIGVATGRAVTRDERLREIYLGDESVAHIAPADRARTVRERLEAFAELAVREGTWATLPDVEAASDVRARMRAAVRDIATAHAGEHVALVSHAGSINAYLAEVVGVARDFFFPIRNASLNSIRLSADRTLLLRLNDTAHLERPRQA